MKIIDEKVRRRLITAYDNINLGTFLKCFRKVPFQCFLSNLILYSCYYLLHIFIALRIALHLHECLINSVIYITKSIRVHHFIGFKSTQQQR